MAFLPNDFASLTWMWSLATRTVPTTTPTRADLPVSEILCYYLLTNGALFQTTTLAQVMPATRALLEEDGHLATVRSLPSSRSHT